MSKKLFFLLLAFILVAVVAGITVCRGLLTPTLVEISSAVMDRELWPDENQATKATDTLTVPSSLGFDDAQSDHLSVRHLSVDGITLYEVYHANACTGSMVIFLHEQGNTKESWIDELKLYARMGFFCIAMDLPGCGERAVKEWISVAKSVIQSTKDIDTILSYYRLHPVAKADAFHLVGVSMGGSAVYHYLAFGQRTPVSAVIACSSPDYASSDDRSILYDGETQSAALSEPEYQELTQDENPAKQMTSVVRIPLLVYHDRKDPVIPVDGTLALEEYAWENDVSTVQVIYDDRGNHGVSKEFLALIPSYLVRYK